MSAELIKAAAEPIARDALDLAVASWFRRLGAPAAVAELASWANYADRQANAAVSLQQVAQWSQATALPSVPESEWILPAEEFDNSPVRPLVVDDQQRVFLYRNYAGEREVAAHLVARLQGTQAKPVKEEMITQLFGPAKGSEDALQREAVRRAARHRLFVLAGGPGTGKTTTVFRMLLAAQAQAVEVALAAISGMPMKTSAGKVMKVPPPAIAFRSPPRNPATRIRIRSAMPRRLAWPAMRGKPAKCGAVAA